MKGKRGSTKKESKRNLRNGGRAAVLLTGGPPGRGEPRKIKNGRGTIPIKTTINHRSQGYNQ